MAARPLPLLSEYLTKMQKELKRVMDFWLRHSHDEERGFVIFADFFALALEIVTDLAVGQRIPCFFDARWKGI